MARHRDPIDLPPDAYQRLLAAFDPDPRRAAERYAELRHRLLRLFEGRGARFPEDLADEVFTRVARRLGDGTTIQSEDPYRYLCGVAHLLFKEVLRDAQRHVPIEDPDRWTAPQTQEGEDDRLAALRGCLGELSPTLRQLVLDYHEGERRGRIDNRRELADKLGIPLNALRIRVHRLRSRLEHCVAERLSAENSR